MTTKPHLDGKKNYSDFVKKRFQDQLKRSLDTTWARVNKSFIILNPDTPHKLFDCYAFDGQIFYKKKGNNNG